MDASAATHSKFLEPPLASRIGRPISPKAPQDVATEGTPYRIYSVPTYSVAFRHSTNGYKCEAFDEETDSGQTPRLALLRQLEHGGYELVWGMPLVSMGQEKVTGLVSRFDQKTGDRIRRTLLVVRTTKEPYRLSVCLRWLLQNCRFNPEQLEALTGMPKSEIEECRLLTDFPEKVSELYGAFPHLITAKHLKLLRQLTPSQRVGACVHVVRTGATAEQLGELLESPRGSCRFDQQDIPRDLLGDRQSAVRKATGAEVAIRWGRELDERTSAPAGLTSSYPGMRSRSISLSLTFPSLASYDAFHRELLHRFSKPEAGHLGQAQL